MLPIENIITYAVIVGGFGSTIYLNRGWFIKTDKTINDLRQELQAVIQNHHECREELPEKYANKKDVNEQYTHLCTRVDDHEKRISFREGKNDASLG